MSKYSEADDYIEQVCSYIKFPLIRKKAANELMNHIDDKVFEYVHLGVDSKEAGLRAIEEMGAPEDVGRSINNLYSPKINKIFIAAIIVMLTVGLVLRCYMDVINHEFADSFFVNSIQYVVCIVILLAITFSRFSYAKGIIRANSSMYFVIMLTAVAYPLLRMAGSDWWHLGRNRSILFCGILLSAVLCSVLIWGSKRDAPTILM